MNTSPITTWEGASAYFTFADKPVALAVICAVAAVVCLYAIYGMIAHENARYEELRRR